MVMASAGKPTVSVTERCADFARAQSPYRLHCPHESERNPARWGDEGVMLKTERCCNCGATRTLRFELKVDGAHGRYAPRIWVLVSWQPFAGATGLTDPPGPAAGSQGQQPEGV